MNDRTAMVVTVVGSSVGMAALLLTVMTLLIGSVNTRIDDLQSTVNTRISDLQSTMNARNDDTNSRVEDVNDRMTVRLVVDYVAFVRCRSCGRRRVDGN